MPIATDGTEEVSGKTNVVPWKQIEADGYVYEERRRGWKGNI